MYSCPNDYGNGGHYIPPGHYWQDSFVANGTVINAGSLELGANEDGQNHQATVGIWSDPGLTNPVTTTVVNVVGYDGVQFALPQATVVPGRTYYLGVRAIGTLTAYDRIDTNCFIGTVVGRS
jgi:hypothetical protein